jgi:hypothetical protein
MMMMEDDGRVLVGTLTTFGDAVVLNKPFGIPKTCELGESM